MRVSVLASRIGAALLLGAFGCRHEPDVVADVDSASTNAGTQGGTAGDGGNHAGEDAGNGSGTGGSEASGSGASGSGTSGGVVGSSAGAGGTSGDGGGGGDAGSAGSAKPDCPLPQGYAQIRYIVTHNCMFKPELLPVAMQFIDDEPPPPPVAEEGPFDTCDITGWPWYPRQDGTIVLCDASCNNMKEFLAEADRRIDECMGFTPPTDS